MAVKYCNLCRRSVETSRQIGVGTFVAIFLTGFFWLFAIPFYRQRCNLCRGLSLSNKPPRENETSSLNSEGVSPELNEPLLGNTSDTSDSFAYAINQIIKYIVEIIGFIGEIIAKSLKEYEESKSKKK